MRFQEWPQIQLIKWLGNSPDLNPIENLWAWMKLQLREAHPSNLEELKTEITRLWVIRLEDSDWLRKNWGVHFINSTSNKFFCLTSKYFHRMQLQGPIYNGKKTFGAITKLKEVISKR